MAGYTSINAVVKAELFPTNVRALGVGVPYALTVSIFGGTAPAIALALKTAGPEDWFFYYLAGVVFVADLCDHAGYEACVRHAPSRLNKRWITQGNRGKIAATVPIVLHPTQFLCSPAREAQTSNSADRRNRCRTVAKDLRTTKCDLSQCGRHPCELPQQEPATSRATGALKTMSTDDHELEPGDFHLAVRRREHSETPWRWEIWAAGRTKAVEQSKRHYASMAEAAREGKAALKAMLRKHFPSAA